MNNTTEETGIAGLECERIVVDNALKRIVKFDGQVCPMIHRDQETCKQDTSYRGSLLWSRETYQTPIGIVERVFNSWGAGLEHTSVKWAIVTNETIREIQERFAKAATEYEAAKSALIAVSPAIIKS